MPNGSFITCWIYLKDRSHNNEANNVITFRFKSVVHEIICRTGSIDVVQESRSYFEIELPNCLINKNKTNFCHLITVWILRG